MRKISRRLILYVSIGLMLMTLMMTGGCALFPGSVSSSSTDQGSVGGDPANSPRYYDFGDVLIPRELKVDRDESFIYQTPGFAAGVLASVGVALLFKAVLPGLLPIGYGGTALFGAVAGLLTIAGDLVESALKRSAFVKDSGGIIPGRGGILDSIDSWLLTAPMFYFVFLWISR